MSLMIYNTLTRKKEPFTTIEPGKVRMYVCGVTVYDYCHLGHARSYIVWDMVRRYLQWRGYDVCYVQNFTDIDDKIIRRSQEENLPWQDITHKYIDAYLEDMKRLNILPAVAYPKATEVIPQIIDFIKRLIDQGYAYAADGDVYYAVEKFPPYGKLSGRKLDQMEAGASGRVDEEAETKKRHPLDFALWKAAKPGEPEWESPWGMGRPGWHIECSAMVKELLGDRIDIHTGGEDLVFPHHENEIAQSEAALAKPLSTFWLHNGFVKIRGDKMSKSLKNFTTIRSLLETTDPMVVRLFVLQAHYRSPIDFTDEAIAAAENGWKTISEALESFKKFSRLPDWSTYYPGNLDSVYVERFNEAMDDDFNTPVALSVIFELAKELRREQNLLTHQGKPGKSTKQIAEYCQTLAQLLNILGLKAEDPAPIVAERGLGISRGDVVIISKTEMTDAEVDALVQQRNEARKAKNWAESDRIRNELQEKGITLIDDKGGVTRWHRN
ncbi:cysteinyl-tRNA synthetase [Leptolyngbyaceae cyanobacterium JSC-12]|nr:cysteinyl-tRNA synthetase [Leptolyngbyaceae cyanobacterium JSC-12]